MTAASHRVVLVNADGSSVPWSAHTTNIGAQRMLASLTKSAWRHQSAALRGVSLTNGHQGANWDRTSALGSGPAVGWTDERPGRSASGVSLRGPHG